MLGRLLGGAAFGVIFTLQALKDEKKQTRHLQEERRQLLAGEIQYFGGPPRELKQRRSGQRGECGGGPRSASYIASACILQILP